MVFVSDRDTKPGISRSLRRGGVSLFISGELSSLMSLRIHPVVLAALTLCLAASAVTAAEEAGNVIDALQARLDRGEIRLAYDDRNGHGWMPDLLNRLGMPRDSQLLVFSKSSLQFEQISPRTPRALYFGTDVAVGTVQGGRLLELITNDRKDGLRFYTLDAAKTDRPRFVRQSTDCDLCHSLAGKGGPGMLVANFDVDPSGDLPNVDPAMPFRMTDDTTPFTDRYGGWYVTGQTGAMMHRGNVTMDFSVSAEPPPGGLNVTDLSGKIDLAKYLSPGSDIVALLVLEHQVGVVNLINQANVRCGGKGGCESREAQEVIAQLARYMTFTGAVPLPSPVTGSSGYAAAFTREGPRDAQGRSLRDLDLKTRLLRYPLSYMLYSDAFASLNPIAREKTLRLVHDDLTARKTDEARAAIAIAAAAPPPGLPGWWK